MEKTGFDRYGLTGNPFRELTSESTAEVRILHVTQRIDVDLRMIAEESFEMVNKSAVLLVGEKGVGKTQRLLLMKEEAQEKNIFWVYRTVTPEIQWNVSGIAKTIIEHTKVGLFSKPSWYKTLSKVSKSEKREFDAAAVGKAIANGLNHNAPAVLLINDIHEISEQDREALLDVFQVIIDSCHKGILIMMTCNQVWMEQGVITNSVLQGRINEIIRVNPLTVDEASLLLAKRMLLKRYVEDLDPIYPFTNESVAVMNDTVSGNPRNLLVIAEGVIEYAVKRRAIQIDEDLTREAINQMVEAGALVLKQTKLQNF